MITPDPVVPRLISVRNAAVLLDVSEDFIRAEARRRNFPVHRSGRTVRLLRADVESIFTPVRQRNSEVQS